MADVPGEGVAGLPDAELLARRRAAITAGAVPVTWRETGEIMAAARARGPAGPPAEASAGGGERLLITPESAAADVPGGQLPAGRIRALTLRQPWALAVAETKQASPIPRSALRGAAATAPERPSAPTAD